MLIVSTAFYIYGNIRLKEISIMDAFEQIQENTIAGSAFSARLGSLAVAFILVLLWMSGLDSPTRSQTDCVSSSSGRRARAIC